LMLGCLVIVGCHSNVFRRHPGFFKVLIPATFLLYVILALGFDINAHVAGAVGRDPTLTDRTRIWSLLLTMQTNPILGTGYESFWMGPRLLRVWQQFGHINEAHNGYLEVYLNLGIIGLLLFCIFLTASYRIICRKLRPLSTLPSLALAFWTVLLFYGLSEAAFRGGLMWFTFLLGALAIPMHARSKTPGLEVAAFGNSDVTEKSAIPVLK
jgi:exopolysaccharide production protein ExoQ